MLQVLLVGLVQLRRDVADALAEDGQPNEHPGGGHLDLYVVFNAHGSQAKRHLDVFEE